MKDIELFDTIQETVNLFLNPGAVTEIRILDSGRGTVSGYFDDSAKLAASVVAWNNLKKGQIYFIPNPLNPDLLARRCNRLEEFTKQTSSDQDVTRRLWFLLDFDPRRVSGIPSNDQEHIAALLMAKRVAIFLKKLLNWPNPVYSDSGNGAHLCYPINLPNDSESRDLIKCCLEALDFRFSDQKVQIDVGTFNAARLIRLYGTLSRKGDDMPDRPHRHTRTLYKPKTISRVSIEQLRALAAMNPERSRLV